MTTSFAAALEDQSFAVCVELDPPKGACLEPLVAVTGSLAGRVDALVVSDNAGAQARMSPLAAAARLKQETRAPVVVTLNCRDRNRLALTSDILAAAAWGLGDLLLVSGDYVSLGDHPQARPVYDLDSVQALGLAAGLSQGRDLAGGRVDPAPELHLGAVVAAEATPLGPHLLKARKKVEAGARFLITLPLGQAGGLAKLREALEGLPVKLLAGLQADDEDLAAAAALAGKLREAGADGVHLRAGQPERLSDFLSALGR